MSEIKYEIVKKIGVLSKSASGWAKELNLISWNERDAKYAPSALWAPPPNTTSKFWIFFQGFNIVFGGGWVGVES